jgi:hypothetical protein
MKTYKIKKAQKTKHEPKSTKTDLKNLLKNDKAIKAIVFGAISLIVLYFLSATFADSHDSRDKAQAPQIAASEETRLEQKLHRAISALDGVGELTIVITLDADNNIRGAAVIAHGAQDAVVRERISEITSRLLGIGTNRISVSY